MRPLNVSTDNDTHIRALLKKIGQRVLEDVWISGRALAAARAEEAAAREQARELAIAAIAAGQTEAGVARALGVDRMAVRNWLGKRK